MKNEIPLLVVVFTKRELGLKELASTTPTRQGVDCCRAIEFNKEAWLGAAMETSVFSKEVNLPNLDLGERVPRVMEGS